jgi:site-specific recombinase XerC
LVSTQTAPATDSVGIESLILDFLAYLELERGLSRNTLEAYRSDLLQFGEFLDRRGVAVLDAQRGDERDGRPRRRQSGARSRACARSIGTCDATGRSSTIRRQTCTVLERPSACREC